MGDVVQFGSRKEPTAPTTGELLLSINIYNEGPGITDATIDRYDGHDVADTLDDVIERTEKLLSFLYLDRYERTKEQHHDLLLTVHVMADSAVRVSWMNDSIFNPAGLAWIRRRLGDAYWSLDRRHGIAYHLRAFRERLRQAFQPKEDEIE